MNDRNKLQREWKPLHIAFSTIGAVLVGASLIYVCLTDSTTSMHQIFTNPGFILFCLGFVSGILITLGFSGRKKPREQLK